MRELTPEDRITFDVELCPQILGDGVGAGVDVEFAVNALDMALHRRVTDP